MIEGGVTRLLLLTPAKDPNVCAVTTSKHTQIEKTPVIDYRHSPAAGDQNRNVAKPLLPRHPPKFII